ncbi:MAG: zinc-dependent metalloprotease [Microbacteriaceae bacterium]|nr:zinc-dependent metalloprotease [Microbacteriaceae bacterium]
MSERDDFAGQPDDESLNDLQRMLNEMLSGSGTAGAQFDPAMFAQAAGLPGDAAALQGLFATLQQAMQNPSGDIDWSVARRTAIDVASQGSNTGDPAAAERAFSVASLWLDEVTELGATPDAPRTLTRVEWVQQTIDTWISLAEPVAQSIARALTDAVSGQLPEEMQRAVGGFAPMLKSVAGALFATQLGQIIGKLSNEVVAGGDVGIPLFEGPGREGGVLIPSGVATFAEGLEQDADAVNLFLATRELAHARWFRHTRWLRLHLISAITDYARGMHINTMQIEELARDLDPSDTEAMQQLVSSGALIPPRTPEQDAAHERLETMLALIEGWVDVVTDDAVSRIPGHTAIAEMVRRRRAAGGPAEHAFSTLVGLELRPRRMREAAAMWRLVAERGGVERRDALWAHPDLLPSAEELDHPARLLERLGLAGEQPEDAPADEFDRALAELLRDSTGDESAAGSDL